MKPKRKSVLHDLNELRKQKQHNFNEFNRLYHKHKKFLQPEDQSILDVYFVECALSENKRKEALDWALSNFKLLEYNQDLKCLLGSIYYSDGNYIKALKYYNTIDYLHNSQQFNPEWYTDGTLQLCCSVSLELLINSLFSRGLIEYKYNNNPQKAVKSWEICFNLISTNSQSIIHNLAMYNDIIDTTTTTISEKQKNIINLPLYSSLAYQCIVNISRIMLQSGQLSSCLANIRASLQLSSYLIDKFHRQMLFKLGLLTFHYLSPVDWNKYSSLLSSNKQKQKQYVYIPANIDEESILSLMVHQRLCQLTLQRSMRHKHRRRAKELQLQKIREQQKSIIHEHSDDDDMDSQDDDGSVDSLDDDIKDSDDDDDNDDIKDDIKVKEDIKQQQMQIVVEYILADDDREQIEGENLLSLLFLTILLASQKSYFPLSKCILRSLNESQIDCSIWYKYALSLYGNNQLNESIRACFHTLSHDTSIDTSSYGCVGPGDLTILRHHFCLSASLLATRCALLLNDHQSAMNYSRYSVKLSIDFSYLKKCRDGSCAVLVDQRSISYLLFSISCSLSASNNCTLLSFRDAKSLHKLSIKSIIRSCILSPRNSLIVFNLSLCRAELGDIEGSLDDIRSLLQNLYPYHSESWHLLSLLLSSKRKWMESYRAIDQALRYSHFNFIGSSSNNSNKLRIYYKYKLRITKAKILMKQNRISSPLQIFCELASCLNFNEKFYKLTKLPNSTKFCPLFQPIIKENDGVFHMISFSKNINSSQHISSSLLLLRLEYILTLTTFYLSSRVGALKYAFHCCEFALQFFGAVSNNPIIISNIYYKLGECCELLNQLNLACEHYKTSILYNLSHYNSLCGISRIYLLQNKLNKSKQYLNNALKINSNNSTAWSILAQLQQQQKQFKKASNSYLTSLELQRDKPIEPFSSVPRWLP